MTTTPTHDLGALTEESVRRRAHEILDIGRQGADKLAEFVLATAQAEAETFTNDSTLARVRCAAENGYSDLVVYGVRLYMFSPYNADPATVVYHFRRQVQEAAADLIVAFLE